MSVKVVDQNESKTLIWGCNNSIIPTNESVTSIGGGAFSYCSGLTGDLVIPDTVTSIGGWAFSGCSRLSSITILSTEPPTLGSSALTGTSALTAIYVPDESVDVYKAVAGWSTYVDLIKPLSEKPTE